ncbi:MAG: hypothetical protein ACOZE5_08435 [Verrucomicrobiota bacterium]
MHSEEFLRLRRRVSCRAHRPAPAKLLRPGPHGHAGGGFHALSWLLLGVLCFPLVWTISYFFIRRSIWLEEDEVAQVKKGRLDLTPLRVVASA